ncbi:MAG: cyanophycinase [Herpetosiphon sp.]
MTFDPNVPTDSSQTNGVLMLIGGAEDKAGNRSVLRRFVQLAGGDDARIGIVATASSIPEIVAATYERIFTELDVRDVCAVPLYRRENCLDEATIDLLNGCTGIFLTGGNQLKLMTVLGGTPAATRIRRRFRHGSVVAGTSAGASAVCEHMLAYGRSGITPRKDMMHFSPGLGLISRVVVDQHFGERGRTGRLITAVAHNPNLLGLGLDEDTAVEIAPDQRLRVFGRGSVMVVDGGDVGFNDLPTISDHAPLAVFNLRLHVLTHGHSFDIPSRLPLVPDAPVVPFEPPTEHDAG